MPASKGPNIHIIGAISQNGLEYWGKRRGSYKKEEASNFVKRLIRTLLRLGPYSPQINPVEAAWSFVKDKFKGLHATVVVVLCG